MFSRHQILQKNVYLTRLPGSRDRRVGSNEILNLSRNCVIGGKLLAYRRYPYQKGQVLVAASKAEKTI